MGDDGEADEYWIKIILLYIINTIKSNKLFYFIVLTARTEALSFFENPAHDRDSNPHLIF